MRAKMTAHGAEALQIALRHAARRVPEGGRKAMHRIADKIVEEAQLNAPVDEHNLEQSIHKEVSYGLRGRLQVDIEMGGVVNGVDVSQYALFIHELYDQMSPGEGTIQKRLANPGRYVGEKFLTRAFEKHKNSITPTIKVAILKEFKL